MRGSRDCPVDEKGRSPKKMWEKCFDHRLNPGGQACGLLHSPLITCLESQGTNQKDLKVGQGKARSRNKRIWIFALGEFRDD